MKTFIFERKHSPTRTWQRRSVVAPAANSPNCSQRAEIRQILRGSNLQPKLVVGAPNDVYEQEAELVTDRVMRMADPYVQHQTAFEVKEEDEDMIQTISIARNVTPTDECQTASEVPTIIHEVLNSPGQPLNRATRTFMESRFGHDFSMVRVYADAKAAESAQAVHALAYTVGQNIVFGKNQYAPQTHTGQKVLAHELTHTIQQSGGLNPEESPAQTSVQRLGDPEKKPEPFDCEVADSKSLPIAEAEYILFDDNISAFEEGDRHAIAYFARTVREASGDYRIRIDGYASNPGGEELNWRLSCERVLAVANELKNPYWESLGYSDTGINELFSATLRGFSSDEIDIYAHGRTDEFGSVAQNRRVGISLLAPAPDLDTGTPSQSQPVAAEETPAEVKQARTAAANALTKTASSLERAISARDNNQTISQDVMDAQARYFPGTNNADLDTLLSRIKPLANWIQHIPVRLRDTPHPGDEDEQLPGFAFSAPEYPSPNYIALYSEWKEEPRLQPTILLHEAFHFSFSEIRGHDQDLQIPLTSAFSYQGFVSALGGLATGPSIDNIFFADIRAEMRASGFLP